MVNIQSIETNKILVKRKAGQQHDESQQASF